MNLKKPYKQILIVLRDFLILVAIGNAISIFTIERDLWSLETVLRNCMFSIMIGYPAWKGMAAIIIVLERKLPWLKNPIRRLVIQVASMTIFAGIIIFFGFSVWLMLSEEVTLRIVFPFILPSLKVVYIFMIGSLVIGNSVLFFKNWRESAIQQEELKRAHLALKYQSLKDQVRPHFLFNSLSSLVTLINTDADKATLFVHKLSDVYRYLLEQRETELVTLKEELKFLEDYIFLQKIRFGDNLQVEYNLDLDTNRMVIPLSMQMLFENAIKHNEISLEQPLKINILSTVENHVIIKNSMQKKKVSEESLGMGLNNLRTRIAFFSDEPMVVHEWAESFIVRIPTITSKPVDNESGNH